MEMDCVEIASSLSFLFSKYKCYFRIQEAIEDEIFLGKLGPTYSKKMNGNSLGKHFKLINSISLCLPSLEVGKMFSVALKSWDSGKELLGVG